MKEVDFKWVRTVVSDGFPMSFFENEEVHKSVLMTSECEENYIRTKPGGVKETTVPYHTFFTTKLIPKLDNFIDHKNMGKMREMTQELEVGRKNLKQKIHGTSRKFTTHRQVP